MVHQLFGLLAQESGDHVSRNTAQSNLVQATIRGIAGVCETGNDLFFFWRLPLHLSASCENWHRKKTRGTPANLRGAQFGKHWSRGTKTFHKILRGTSAKKVKKHWIRTSKLTPIEKKTYTSLEILDQLFTWTSGCGASIVTKNWFKTKVFYDLFKEK